MTYNKYTELAPGVSRGGSSDFNVTFSTAEKISEIGSAIANGPLWPWIAGGLALCLLYVVFALSVNKESRADI